MKPKKKAASTTAAAAPVTSTPSDRRARIAVGQKVRDQTKKRIDQAEYDMGADFTNGKRLAKSTHERYLKEIISTVAVQHGLEPSEIQICVDLAALVEQAGLLDTPEWKDAILSGALMLTKDRLKVLLKSSDLEGQLKAYCAEQI